MADDIITKDGQRIRAAELGNGAKTQIVRFDLSNTDEEQPAEGFMPTRDDQLAGALTLIERNDYRDPRHTTAAQWNTDVAPEFPVFDSEDVPAFAPLDAAHVVLPAANADPVSGLQHPGSAGIEVTGDLTPPAAGTVKVGWVESAGFEVDPTTELLGLRVEDVLTVAGSGEAGFAFVIFNADGTDVATGINRGIAFVDTDMLGPQPAAFTLDAPTGLNATISSEFPGDLAPGTYYFAVVAAYGEDLGDGGHSAPSDVFEVVVAPEDLLEGATGVTVELGWDSISTPTSNPNQTNVIYHVFRSEDPDALLQIAASVGEAQYEDTGAADDGTPMPGAGVATTGQQSYEIVQGSAPIGELHGDRAALAYWTFEFSDMAEHAIDVKFGRVRVSPLASTDELIPDVSDGETSGWSWRGAANASQSYRETPARLATTTDLAAVRAAVEQIGSVQSIADALSNLSSTVATASGQADEQTTLEAARLLLEAINDAATPASLRDVVTAIEAMSGGGPLAPPASHTDQHDVGGLNATTAVPLTLEEWTPEAPFSKILVTLYSAERQDASFITRPGNFRLLRLIDFPVVGAGTDTGVTPVAAWQHVADPAGVTINTLVGAQFEIHTGGDYQIAFDPDAAGTGSGDDWWVFAVVEYVPA